MRILVTNDDGVGADGLVALSGELATEHEVTVVAPACEQSGIGHAFTYQTPLRYTSVSNDNGTTQYAVEGTPSDCVKFAVSHLLSDRPEAVVSGINVGENSGISSIYSGTVAAAREGALWGIPSFAFSIDSMSSEHAGGYAHQAGELVAWLMGLENGDFVMRNPRTFFNVNFPPCTPNKCRGVRITRQSLAFFDDHYRVVQDDGGEGFALSGTKQDLEISEDYDSRALLENYATLTPLGLDATDHGVLTHLRGVAPLGG